MRTILCHMCLAALLGLAASPAWSEQAVPSEPLSCVFFQAFECTPEDGCEATTPEELDAPRLIKIDLAEGKLVAASRTAGALESTIKLSERVGENLILQGLDGALPWSLTLNSETHLLTGAATDDDSGFVMFGICVPPSGP